MERQEVRLRNAFPELSNDEIYILVKLQDFADDLTEEEIAALVKLIDRGSYVEEALIGHG